MAHMQFLDGNASAYDEYLVWKVRHLPVAESCVISLRVASTPLSHADSNDCYCSGWLWQTKKPSAHMEELVRLSFMEDSDRYVCFYCCTFPLPLPFRPVSAVPIHPVSLSVIPTYLAHRCMHRVRIRTARRIRHAECAV